jgi:hypothetical protein
LSFPVVASSILHLFKESVEFNLQKILPAIAKPVTGSAFTQARYKIKPAFFEDLSRLVVDSYKGADKKLWKGLVLLAGDGSTLNLPPSKDIEESFGAYAITDMGVKRYLARVFFIYDVMNDFVVECKLSTMGDGEKTLMTQCLEGIDSQGNVLVLDRCFGNFTTIKELANRQIKFCVRLTANGSNFAKKAMGHEEEDFITVWEPSKKEIENSRKNGLDRGPIKVRVTKVKLKTGETELLVSNLFDQQRYTALDMGELYHLRWGVEEGFKNLKPKMKIEQFGCRKSRGVFQEFYAHIFFMNMVSLAGNAATDGIAQKTKGRRLKYKYNWKNAYRFLREKIIGFLWCEDIQKLLGLLIAEITSSIVALKPDRLFPRDTRDSNIKGRITQFNK